MYQTALTGPKKWYGESLSTLLQDLRYGVRGLRNNIGITAVAVISLSLGMGVNTSMFGVANGLLARSLPAHGAEGLVALHGIGVNGCCEETSYPDFKSIRAHTEGRSGH